MDDVEQIAQYAELAQANDQWWYRLGVDEGRRVGRDEVLAELEADWHERRLTEALVPTGETGPDGLPIYVLRLKGDA